LKALESVIRGEIPTIKKRVGLVVVIVLVVLLASPALPATVAQENLPPVDGPRPDAPPCALPASHWVGTRKFMIDTDGVAVWGHSTGGTTVFQAGGAQIDLPALLTNTITDKALVTFENGGHLMFSSCSDGWKEFCSDDSVWNVDRVHDLVNRFSTAFLLTTLKGDSDAVSLLSIEYQAEGF
jgi:hypothetical protein